MHLFIYTAAGTGAGTGRAHALRQALRPSVACGQASCLFSRNVTYLFISHMITRPRRGPRGTTRRRQAKFSFLWNFMANIPWPTSQTTAVHYSHAPRGSWDTRTCAYHTKMYAMRVHHARPHAAGMSAGRGPWQKSPIRGVCVRYASGMPAVAVAPWQCTPAAARVPWRH